MPRQVAPANGNKQGDAHKGGCYKATDDQNGFQRLIAGAEETVVDAVSHKK